MFTKFFDSLQIFIIRFVHVFMTYSTQYITQMTDKVNDLSRSQEVISEWAPRLKIFYIPCENTMGNFMISSQNAQ